MADHARIQLRDLVKTALTGLATTGANVFVSRPNDFALTELPGLNILAEQEHSSAVDVAESTLERILTISVEIRAAATGDVEKTIDDIAAEVETAVAAIAWPTENIKAAVLTNTQKSLHGQGATPEAYARLDFDITYYTTNAAPDVLL